MTQALGAIGVGFSAAGIVQLGREFIDQALAAEKLATAYNRQRVAATNLAGSQAQLNELLEVYDQATGGIVDNASALQNVTKLLAVGFADSSEELDKFARAIRGISVAMGVTQDFATQNLILDLFSQRGMRLDQLGLQYDKVRQRSEQLQAADSSLTRQMAYQQAVLEQAEERFGKLADTTEGARTGVERLTKAWKDFRLELAQELKPDVDQATNDLADLWEWLVKLRNAHAELAVAAQRSRAAQEGRTFAGDIDSRTSIGRVTPQVFNRAGEVEDLTERNAAINEWARGVAQIERQAANDRLDATRDFEQQRASTIRQYNTTLLREAQDFATQRGRAEEDHEKAIGDIHEAAAQRDIRMAEDLARTIGRARQDSDERLADMQADLDRTVNQRREDSAERVAEWEQDRDEAIAERRKDSAERLLELEQDFAAARERAQRDSRDRMEDAAARLDARAVWQEQRRFERESKDALDAHSEKVSDEKTKLQEAIDQLNKAHAERLADEKKSLAKSIDQANEAHQRQAADEKKALDKRIADANEAYQRQLADARLADEQRIADMEADFALRKSREDADRSTRLGRLAQDHTEQLKEMASAHADRIAQIGRHAAAERKAHDDAFLEELKELGIHNEAWANLQRAREAAALDLFDEWWKEINKRFGITIGPLPQNPFNTPPGTWPKLIPTPPQPGVNPGGGAAPVQPSPMPYGTAAAITRYAMPAPTTQVAATGTGGGAQTISISLAVYGAPGQSEERLADIIDRRILETVRKATRRT